MGETMEIDGMLDATVAVGMPVGVVKEGSRVTEELPSMDIEAFIGETIEIDGTDVVTGKTLEAYCPLDDTGIGDDAAVEDDVTGSVTDGIGGFCGEGTVNFALFIDELLVE